MATMHRMSELHDWKVADGYRDVRGEQLQDAQGRDIGEIKDFRVDTDREIVTGLLLSTGAHVPVDDVIVKKDRVLLKEGVTIGNAAAAAERTDQQRTRDYGAAEARGETVKKVPRIEEDLEVGKREVSGGGVRVRTDVHEKDVEEHVRLRQEDVEVERRPVNRKATDEDMRAVADGEFRVPVIREEVVATKTPRVVEEVVVKKTGSVKDETVRDTVRSSDVVVEELEPDFKRDFNTRFGGKGKYEDYSGAYQIGSRYGRDPNFANRDWEALEPQMRSDWEKQGYSNWQDARGASRYGWDRSREMSAREKSR